MPLLIVRFVQKYIDYYQVIKEPIDLRMIAQKIQSNGYSCLEEMYKDLMLMTQNAKTFNKPTSTIYKVKVGLNNVHIIDLMQSCTVR